MVFLAERQVHRSTSVLTLGATFALTLVASLRTGDAPAALPPPSVEPAAPRELPPPAPATDNCPAEVRAQLHLAAPKNVVCIAGNYATTDRYHHRRGYFVHATYDTTETWERFGIVTDDGRMLLPLTDRPLLRPMSFFRADLDGDGRDEIVGSLAGCSEVLIDIMAIHGGALSVTSQSIPVHGGTSGCAAPSVEVISFVSADSIFATDELQIQDAIYRLDRGWLVFARSARDTY
jgi:hypothetical protein